MGYNSKDIERFSQIRHVTKEESELLFFLGSEMTPEFLIQHEEIQQSRKNVGLQSSAEIRLGNNHINILMHNIAETTSSMNIKFITQMGTF